jgi:hypothetical protein
MTRSFFSTRFILIAVIALALLASATAAFAGSRRSIDLGAGHSLEMEGSSGKIVQPPAVVKPALQKMDIGSGYTLETIGSTGRIVAPAYAVNPVTHRMDLGAGYTLEITGSSGKIVAPAVVIKSVLPRLDLGAGYTLEPNGKIVSPAAAFKPKAAAVNARTQDLGSGFWLVDGKIMSEGSR